MSGGAYFDGVSFHAYDYYWNTLGQYGNSPNWDSHWNTTGPAMIAKAKYINTLLASYGVTGKFLVLNSHNIVHRDVVRTSCAL